jgi:paraquat-inducible protein B
MSRKANPSAIGAFVIGGLTLAIGAIMLLGGGRFFQDTSTYVMYFEGSVSGLRIGAPVEFRGVKVGEVRDILGTVNEELEIQIPVFVQFGGDRLRPTVEGGRITDTEQAIPILIQRGMRAQLELQSLVTGQFYIELDFHPDTPARFVGDGVHREIPTIPSAMSQLASRIQGLPIDELFESALGALNAIEALVSSEEVGGAIGSFQGTLRDMSSMVRELEQKLPPMVEAAEEAFSIAAEGSPVRYRLEDTLSELSAAARSIRVFADYLAQHPEALLTGKRAYSD